MSKVLIAGMLVAMLSEQAVVAADAFPNKAVRVLVGAPPGSGSDVMMRIVSLKLSERWNRSVVIDNRAGALGAISLDIAAQAAPDGYTLTTLSGQNLTGMLLKTVQVDIPKAFTPVVRMVVLPYLLVVTPSLPVNSVKELIALAKAKPLVYASSGTGSVVHLGMEMLKAMAGVPLTHIPYKGSGQSMVDVISGRVQLAITNSLTATPLVRTGKLRALAVTSARRSATFAELPTVAEAGVSGFELTSWYGIFAPAKTPMNIVRIINRDVMEVMYSPEMKEKLAADAAEPAPRHTPEAFQKSVAREVEMWDNFLKTSGIKME
ncbi:MAG TPA: tripartite tricarboxylate transporter substrate-binding protein [Burkholderiales bacterium]|nr:tripartite tricarboxylate transporter substrate-binding protein [Burkholderiales bacterium]